LLSVGETVPAETRLVLGRLGLADCLSAEEHLPSTGNMARWGAESLRVRESILNCYGSGWHLDRKRFDGRLIDEADRAGVTLICARFEDATWSSARGWRMRLGSGAGVRDLDATYAIDCTGRSARLAVAAGARRCVHDKLVAIWAVLEWSVPSSERDAGARDDDRQTYVESVPDGWWYTARIPGGRRVVAYFTDGDLLDRRVAQSAAAFARFLSAFGNLREVAPWTDYRVVTGPKCLPAMSLQLDRAYGSGWIAAGDAAHCFDPLASQGIMAAIISGNNAAAALVEFQARDRTGLAAYQERLNARYAMYLSERKEYYLGEQRWSGNTFWRRRHGKYPILSDECAIVATPAP
jgi:flavin-dependent dehydrogenase